MPTADVPHPTPPPPTRAWYSASIAEFLATPSDIVFARLADNREFDLATEQKHAWQHQLALLHTALNGLDGLVCFEFTVPRMGRRIDVVLVIGAVVFVVEFKVGEDDFTRSALDQVWDYALDLKNFHAASHDAAIVPILVATEASESQTPATLRAAPDRVYTPLLSAPANLRAIIDQCRAEIPANTPLHIQSWLSASYRPSPTIVEAARALYAQHSVEAIARYDAGAQNLAITSRRIEALIDDARTHKRKAICFVTGVPGAGKTLVGLNVATQRRDKIDPTHAVFLSGNGPLVAVLREALTRDEVERGKAQGKRLRKGEVRKRVESFIQNIHHFRDEALKDPAPPHEHVVIFDEAQRAWNRQQTSHFMQRKKGQPGFSQSEPEFLIRYMDRHQDWALIVCLVGGGQEINTGEAGISEWLSAVQESFSHWHLYISEYLHDSEYGATESLAALGQYPHAHFEPHLHLAVSMRSFRAESVSAFVKALLDVERDAAGALFAQIRDRFPILLTRDLDSAKRWLRQRARGSERFGVVASSKAMRLKPHAIDIRVSIDPVHWFLNDRSDTRSSYYLEDAATEFQVQGLELDWLCVTWDADLRFTPSGWSYHDFRGDRWINVNSADNRSYLKNAYRVLLTRARQGMVIFVPPGDHDDPTRPPHVYEATYDYLRSLGIPTLS
jgi:Uncharacterized conserved protein (DUF2075).